VLLILFKGPDFLPEYHDGFERYYVEIISEKSVSSLNFKFSNAFYDENLGYTCPNYIDYCTLMASGRFKDVDGSPDYQSFWE
jgi:hypothetical protein